MSIAKLRKIAMRSRFVVLGWLDVTFFYGRKKLFEMIVILFFWTGSFLIESLGRFKEIRFI